MPTRRSLLSFALFAAALIGLAFLADEGARRDAERHALADRDALRHPPLEARP